jgi:hypothetical protein
MTATREKWANAGAGSDEKDRSKKLVPKSADNQADDGPANRSHADDRSVRFCNDASGMLSSSPNNSPTNQPGHGKRVAPMTNPIAKRAMKAAVIAALLSAKVIGSMIPTSTAPKTKPQITPSVILDMLSP